MKTAVVGSRNLKVENLEDYLPKETQEIISGGAKGIDSCAKEYALRHNITLTEIFPKYNMYGRGAPLKRNEEIIAAADYVVIFWDGISRGTKFVIDRCIACNKEHKIYYIENNKKQP